MDLSIFCFFLRSTITRFRISPHSQDTLLGIEAERLDRIFGAYLDRARRISSIVSWVVVWTI